MSAIYDVTKYFSKSYLDFLPCKTHQLRVKISSTVLYPHSSWTPGTVDLRTPAGAHIGTATIRDMIANCGMRQLGGMWVRPHTKEGLTTWLEILEDMIRWFGFSYVVASDGESSGWPMKRAIEQVGTGWTVVSLNKNQRQSQHTVPKHLALMYKYLDWSIPRKFDIDWSKPIAE